MDITFFCAPMSSAIPVACGLSELEVAHRRVTLDLAKQEQRAPDFLRLNPNGKVPTLLVDGTPMFEALAILQLLGATFGVDKQLWPAPGAPGRLTAHSWATWAYTEYGPVVRQLNFATSERTPVELKSEAWANHARTAAQTLLSILDGHLQKTGFIADDHYTLADLIVACPLLWSQSIGVATTDHAHVSKWLSACAARPAIKREFGL